MKYGAAAVEEGWRRAAAQVSLPEVHRSLVVPPRHRSGASCSRLPVRDSWSPSATWIRVTGPPTWRAARNLVTRCCASIMISNLMAILLQHLCIKLGIATGRDLAQACRDHYSQPTVWFLLGSSANSPSRRAIWRRWSARPSRLQSALWNSAGLGLLYYRARRARVLYLQNKGFRYIEALVIALIVVIGGPVSRWNSFFPNRAFSESLSGLFRALTDPHQSPEMLYVSIGILGRDGHAP